MSSRRGGVAATVVATLVATLVALGVLGAAGTAGARAGRPAAAARPRIDRVLVLTLPAVSWADLRDATVPHLDRLLDGAAVGDLSARSVHQKSSPGDGYLTLGAGARATTPDEDAGLGFGVGERYGRTDAGVVYQRRTHRAPGRGLVELDVARTEAVNKKLLFEARPGALGDALARAGVERAVIGNADRGELVTGDEHYQRQPVSTLMGSEGRVPAGEVDERLLVAEPGAPFGLRTDIDATVHAFQKVWDVPGRRSVVLVEASDLARVDAYRALATPDQRARLLREALARTDELVGRLLRSVDYRHDAVLAVTPADPARRVQLGVAALRAPGVTPALLRSSTTRRSGFVQIVDVAPTVLAVLGLGAPERMEGRPFEAGAHGGTPAQRRSILIEADRAARVRDANVGAAQTVFAVFAVVLAAGAVLLFGRGRRGARALLGWGALALLGFLVATFLAGLLPFHRWGDAAYWGFLAAAAALFATACQLLGRGRVQPIVLGLGALVAVHLADALTGAHLELNTVFGYSPTVGIRVAGLGNMGYSQLAAAAVLLAGLLAFRVGGRRGAWVAAGLLALVLVCTGAPFIGQNFGGTLAGAPAFALVVLLLFGRRVTPRLGAALVGLLVVSGLAVGLVDLARPRDQQTHVGRFFAKVGDEGWHGFSVVIRRKLAENVSAFHRSIWIVILVAVLALVLYLAYARPHRLAVITDAIPPLRAALLGFVLLAALGLAFKDSGIAVPAMMAGVLDATLVSLAARVT